MNSKTLARLGAIIAVALTIDVADAGQPKSGSGLSSVPETRIAVHQAMSLPLLDNKLGDRTARTEEAARAAADAKRLQQLRELEQARRLGQNGTEPLDRAAGTPLGNHGIETSRSGADHAPGASFRDCIHNPVDCVAVPDQRGGSEQPAAGAGVPDHRSNASDGRWINRQFNTNRDGSGTYKGNYAANDGTRWVVTIEVSRPGSGGKFAQTSQVSHYDDKGKLIGTSRRIDEHGARGNVISQSFTDSNPEAEAANEVYTDFREQVVNARETGSPGRGSGENPDSTPRDDDRHVGNDNCNWNPQWKRCTKQQTSPRDMTSRPGPGSDHSASDNSTSARPRIGSEAVTNPGDSTFAVTRGSRGGSGKPYDPRDPVPGFEGKVPTPPSK